jgi:hypothetical protein
MRLLPVSPHTSHHLRPSSPSTGTRSIGSGVGDMPIQPLPCGRRRRRARSRKYGTRRWVAPARSGRWCGACLARTGSARERRGAGVTTQARKQTFVDSSPRADDALSRVATCCWLHSPHDRRVHQLAYMPASARGRQKRTGARSRGTKGEA